MLARRPVSLLSAVAATTAIMLTLTGCAGSDDRASSASTDPSNASTSSPGTDQSGTESESTDPVSTTTWAVSDDLGLSFTAETPPGWEQGTKDSVSLVRSLDAVDGFQANVYAQFQEVPAGTTIDTIASSVTSEAAALAGWSSTRPDGRQVSADGKPAFQIAGLIDGADGDQVARSITAVLCEGTDGPVVVYLVASTSPDDEAGQSAIGALLDSVTFG